MPAEEEDSDAPMGRSQTERSPSPAGRTAGQAEGLVRAVDRALGLLELVSDAPQGIALPQLAEQAELAASTAHRLLTTLQDRGFVRFERASGRWFVGRTALTVGAGYAGSRDMVACARPILQRLGDSLGETANLGMLEDGNVVFLQRFDARARRAFVPTGTPLPAHCSSIGKALLSVLPLPEVRDSLAAGRLVAVTSKTMRSQTEVMGALEEARRAGFAVDDEENTPGLRCVAAPVFDAYHRPVAALSLAAPIERLEIGQIAERGRMVAAAAQELTRAWSGARL